MPGVLRRPLAHGQVRAHCTGAKQDCQAYEKKTDNLVPQGTGGFDDGGYDVLNELPPAIGGKKLAHYLIVTLRKVVVACLTFGLRIAD